MKKYFTLISAAALLLVGCAKEIPAVTEGDGAVTFSVALNEATKASADNDGMGANVDNIKVAVYMHTGNVAEPYKFYDAPVAVYDAATKTGTFTVNLIKSQTYQIVVWADKNTRYTCENNLQVIKRAVETVASEDEYDAFFATVTYTQGTSAAEVRNIVAKRPFAQINLITTDVKAGFEPTDMTLSYTAASQFNALTDVASVPAAVTRKAQAYSADASKAKNTLVMDYILVDGTDAAVLSEVTMTAKVVATQENVYNNIPVQRNYRTNIIGALLTSPEDFTVVVDPIWNTPENDVLWMPVASVAEAVEALKNGDATNVTIEKVEQPAEGQDATVLAIPETEKPLGIALPAGNTVPVKIVYETASETAQTPSLNVAANNTAAVEIIAPQSHVTLNGILYQAIVAETSSTTLVIEQGVTVNDLTVKKGGLEIHGTVNALTIPAGADVQVRDSEGLSENVYNALRSFIAAGYKGFKQADGTWNISLSDVWFDRVANQPASFILDEVAKTIHLGDENAFAWFGKNSNKFGNKSYKIYLDADMNLESGWWTPIEFFCAEDHALFDGQNHVIKNLKLSGSQNLGLFGGIAGLDIKNLTIDGAIIKATASRGGYIGTVAHHSYGNFENISVKNTTIFGTYWGIGGVVGFHNAGNLKNCHVENLHITGGCPGGLVGVYNESTRPRVYEDCTATSITLKDNCGYGRPYRYGAIVAVVNAPSLTLKNCSSTEMTYVFKSDSNVYHSGDEGIGTYAPSHALYGDGEEVTIE